MRSGKHIVYLASSREPPRASQSSQGVNSNLFRITSEVLIKFDTYLLCSLCPICVGTQIGKWWFGFSQMHTFVIVVIHLWKSQMWKWWFGLSQMHTFVIVVFSLWCSGMDHKCESGGLASAKRTLLWFCGQAEFGLYNTKGITQLGHKHKWMGLWL